jgi:putative transcriptional regulator
MAKKPRAEIRCRLSRIMGERRVRIAELARATRVNRNMVANLYYERAQRVELADIAAICDYLGCSVADLFELAGPHERPGRESAGKAARGGKTEKSRD